MAVNEFKFCTGLNLLGSFMILVVAVTYYAVVVCTYGPDIFAGGGRMCIAIGVLSPFHLLLAMLLWYYFVTVFTDPGSVPDDWHPFENELHDLEAGGKVANETNQRESSTGDEAKTSFMKEEREGSSNQHLDATQSEGDGRAERLKGGEQPAYAGDAVTITTDSGAPAAMDPLATPVEEVRRCKKCLQYKPPRPHHCSACRRCILKMCHCVWVVNCVGANNYKSFLLFKCYASLESFLVSLSLLPRVIAFSSLNMDGKVAEPGKLAAVFLAFVLNFAFTLRFEQFFDHFDNFTVQPERQGFTSSSGSKSPSRRLAPADASH